MLEPKLNKDGLPGGSLVTAKQIAAVNRKKQQAARKKAQDSIVKVEPKK